MLSANQLYMRFGGISSANGDSAAPLYAVENLSLEIAEGEIVGLIGHSGCGKSTTARLLTGMLKPTSGEVFYQGDSIASFSPEQFKSYWRRVRLIFQSPEAYFNPHFSVDSALREYHAASGCTPENYRSDTTKLLELFSLDSALLRVRPQRLSIGQKRRLSILLNLYNPPQVLIADEPFSGLDTVLKYEIAGELRELRDNFGLGILLISHDLLVLQEMCDRALVMNRACVVQHLQLSAQPSELTLHPYAARLILKRGAESTAQNAADGTAGVEYRGEGCPHAFESCTVHARLGYPQTCLTKRPDLRQLGDCKLACHYPDELDRSILS